MLKPGLTKLLFPSKLSNSSVFLNSYISPVSPENKVRFTKKRLNFSWSVHTAVSLTCSPNFSSNLITFPRRFRTWINFRITNLKLFTRQLGAVCYMRIPTLFNVGGALLSFCRWQSTNDDNAKYLNWESLRTDLSWWIFYFFGNEIRGAFISAADIKRLTDRTNWGVMLIKFVPLLRRVVLIRHGLVFKGHCLISKARCQF